MINQKIHRIFLVGCFTLLSFGIGAEEESRESTSCGYVEQDSCCVPKTEDCCDCNYGLVTLENRDNEKSECVKDYGSEQQIHLFQDEYDGVNVLDEDCWYASLPETDCQFARRMGLRGIWLPECPPAFRPFLADPRQLTYSVGWRFHDKVVSQNVIDFSFGDILPVYRWINVWNLGGDLQFDVEGAVWDVFAPFEKNSPMVNADYYCGFPVTYLYENWAIRLRGYHISCHLGDEFMVNHPHFKRKNPSAEFLDLFVSYQFAEEIRLYGGLGWVCLQDESFKCSPWYAEAGAEIRLPQLGYISYSNRLYGEPFFGMHFRYQPIHKKHFDSTYVLGWEWGKFSGLRHKLRIFLEYHDGYSLEGQFCKEPTNYLSIRASYGY